MLPSQVLLSEPSTSPARAREELVKESQKSGRGEPGVSQKSAKAPGKKTPTQQQEHEKPSEKPSAVEPRKSQGEGRT
jgi:hypothetical protein